MYDVFVRIQGAQHSLWCAVEQNGVMPDILAGARQCPGRQVIPEVLPKLAPNDCFESFRGGGIIWRIVRAT
jgi:hypothetical protein